MNSGWICQVSLLSYDPSDLGSLILDHPKGTQLKILLNTPLPLTLMVWVHCFCTTDIVERIMEHMLNSSRTRRQVVTQLVNLGVVEDRKLLRKKRKKGERKRKKDDGFVVVCQ